MKSSKRIEKKPIRVLVADDHPVVRKGMSTYLSLQGRFAVVGEAQDGFEAIAKVAELSPDIVLMDIHMPKLDGLAATEALHREHPKLKIVIFAVQISPDCAQRIRACGACAYLSKGASLAEIVQAVETVADGGDLIESGLTQAALRAGKGSADAELSPREREVLVAIADGLSNKEISTKLGIEVRTVETRRERVMRKLNIHNAADLTRFALIQGLVPLPTPAEVSNQPSPP